MNGFIRSVGAVFKNSLQVEKEHFCSELPPERAIKLFKDHVELIEVETTSYCNRTCSFCPNSFIDRRSEKTAMPEETWQAILDGLQATNYDGTFVWSRYSEPLSEQRIVDRIKQVRIAAPKSRICVNSNGDYLDSDYLDELRDAGLDRLFIDIYIPDEEEYSQEVISKYLEKFLKRVNKSYTVSKTSPEFSIKLDYSMETSAVFRNVKSITQASLSSRGGLIQIKQTETRVSPCYAPYKHLVIDWDGSVVICCQVRSDSLQHKSAKVAVVGKDGVGLVDSYLKLSGWRNSLKAFGIKDEPCKGCNVELYSSNPVTKKVSELLSDTESPLRYLFKKTFQPVLRKRVRW